MKKQLLLLFPLISALGLASCVKYNGKNPKQKSDDTPSETPSEPSEGPQPGDGGNFGAEVTTYLVLGKYGLYRNLPGQNIESKFLENTVEYVAQSGSALPSEADVTSTVSGSHFKGWQAYEGNGSPKEYTIVPATNGMVLYAIFGDGKGSDDQGGGSGGGDEDTMPISGYGIRFNNGDWVEAPYHQRPDESDGYKEYLISSKEFTAGQFFQLYDFAHKAGWVVTIDSASFGGHSSAYIETNTSTSYYRVKVDFTVDVYIKLKDGADQIYFELKSSPIVVKTGFGIQVNGETDYVGVPSGKEPGDNPRDQYKVTSMSVVAGNTFQVYDFDNGAGWAAPVEETSFKTSNPKSAPWNEYISKGEGSYTVLHNFTVDIYIKIDSGTSRGDSIYFELKSDPIIHSDDEYVTIYFEFPTTYDVGQIQHLLVAINNDWDNAEMTRDGYVFSRVYHVTSAVTAVNAYYQNWADTGGLYGHPTGNGKDTNYSVINTGSISVAAGHSYKITWTSWADHQPDVGSWTHAWFNYTFTEVSA